MVMHMVYLFNPVGLGLTESLRSILGQHSPDVATRGMLFTHRGGAMLRLNRLTASVDTQLITLEMLQCQDCSIHPAGT